MRTKWIVVLILLVCASAGFAQDKADDPNEPNEPSKIDTNGYILSIMSMENPDPNVGNVFLRAGYKYGVLEAFLGLECEEADIYEFGFFLHSRNIAEPDSVAVISPLLSGIFDEEMVITGYTGLHWVKDRKIKEDYSGSIVGINAKSEINSPLSVRGEIHYENNKAEDITFYAGLFWLF